MTFGEYFSFEWWKQELKPQRFKKRMGRADGIGREYERRDKVGSGKGLLIAWISPISPLNH